MPIGIACEQECAFRPIGVVSWGSIPYMIVGFIAFLIVLRVLSLMLVSPDNNNMKIKGNNMEKTKKKTKVVASAILETGWVIGVGIIVGQLST